MQKLDSLQAGRAFAAQYVVLFHVNAVMSDHLGRGLESGFIRAGHSGVEFFFVLSGFIMAHVHWKDIGQSARAGAFFHSRLVRIYPVFWVVLLMTALGQLALGRLEPAFSDPLSVIRAILLVPFDGFPPVTVAWTLSHELLFYAILGVVLLLGRRAFLLLILWWTCCILLIFNRSEVSFPLSFLFSPYNLLFGFGMLCVAFYSRLPFAAAILALVGGLVVFGVTITVDDMISTVIRPILYGTGAMMIISGSARLEMLRVLKTPRFLVFLGDASYSTYLVHSAAMALSASFLVKTGFVPVLSQLEIAVFLLLIGNAVGIAFHVTVERPLTRWLKGSAARPRLARS